MNPDQTAGRVLVDTCVVSFFFKADTRADEYRPYLDGNHLFLSFMSVAELEYWVLARRWGEDRRRRLEEYLGENFVIHSEMSREYYRIWADVTNQRILKGRKIECADAWIAATAIILDIPLVTNNNKDFEGIDGLVLLSAT